MSELPAAQPPGDPGRIADALRAARGEIELFLAGVLAFLRSPARFGAAWGDGELRALNPLAFALNALAVNSIFHVALVKAMRLEVEAPLWAQVVKSAVPFANAVWLSLLAHAFCRAGGSRRPYRSSLGIALYATGPMMVIGFFIVPFMVWSYRDPKRLASVLASGLGGLFMMGMYLVLASGALAGLHRVKRRWPVLGLLVGYAVLFVSWGSLARLNPVVVRWLTF